MAANNRDLSIRTVLGYEGGYVDHPKDPGGPTNYGITLATARAFWKRDATAQDVRDMPIGVAIDIYRRQYWAPVRGDDLPAGVDFATYDYGVNSGPSRAAKSLQKAVGAAVDGVVGPATVAAAKGKNAVATVKAICAERSRFLHALSTWSVFGRGWGRRVADVEARAVKMAVDAKPLSKSIPTLTESTLKKEAGEAKTQSFAELGKAGGAVATPAGGNLLDLPHWMLVVLGLTMAVALVVFVWRWNVQRQRAAAYAAVAKETT